MAFTENVGSDQLSGRTVECPYRNPGQQSCPQLFQVVRKIRRIRCFTES